MRRPLAVFGLCIFLSLLAATHLPTNTLFWLFLGMLLAGGLSFLFCRKGKRAYVPLVCMACGLSLLCKFGYDHLFVLPVQSLSGQTTVVQARVQEVGEGYNEETVSLTLLVKTAEGFEHLPAFRVDVFGMPPYEVDDVIETTLNFESTAGYDSTLWQYTNGVFLSASVEGETIFLKKETTLRGKFIGLRSAAAENIARRLPQRLSSVLSAISLGETGGLSAQTKQAYRMAGISHMLVVSGMHLSLVCFALNRLVFLLTRRRGAAVLAGALAAVLFACFTGFTPSILRSGIAFLLMTIAPLFKREADPFTSLGLAATLLCLQNPYAAVDVGLQFSLSATFGVLLCAQWLTVLHRHWLIVLRPKRIRYAFTSLSMMLVTLCASGATLPVVIYNELGISLLAVPVSFVAVPLLMPLVLGGFLLALPFGFAPLDFLLRPIALLEGVLLVFLETLTEFCTQLPFLYPSLGGGFALTVVLLCYVLLWFSFRTKYKRIYKTAVAVVVLVSLLASQWQSINTVKVSVAGTGSQASLVLSQRGEAVVVYRGRNSLYEIENVFEREGIRRCVLWVDLRKTARSSEAERLFAPETLYIAEESLVFRDILPVSDMVEVYLLRQEDGLLACLDVSGYKIAVANGALNLESYMPLDVLLPADAAVQGEVEYMFITNEAPEWARESTSFLQNGGSAVLQLRPGKSVVYKEASHELFFQEMG